MRRIHVEAFKMAPKKTKSIEEGDKTFSGKDDELSLLLRVIIDYKAYQASNGKDWETVKRKYEDIIKAEYPNGRDKSAFTKERVFFLIEVR